MTTPQLSWRLLTLATVLAGVALLWTLPGWATPIGASIALTNAVFDYDPVNKNLSAEAAAIGGLPAVPLPNNTRYTNTLAGDFAVTVNLPALDEPHTWLISDDLSINGEHLFGGQEVFGPISVTEAVDEALSLLRPGLRPIVMNLFERLLTTPLNNAGGLLDWAYIRDPTDDLTGTFAFGSAIDLVKAAIGESVIPGQFTIGLSASAVAVDVPEPVGVLIFAPAVIGLVLLRWRTARRALETSSELVRAGTVA